MVNEWGVGIRGVGVNGLTLHVIEEEFHIVILSRDDWSITSSGAVLSIEGLQTFPVVVLHKVNIINIVVEFGILLDALMESLEWVIKIRLLSETVNNGVKTHVNSVVDLSCVVLQLIVVDAMILESAIKTLINAVHVNFPQVVNALVNVAVEAVLAGNGGGEEPEEDVLCLQLEYGYRDLKLVIIHCRDSLHIIDLRDLMERRASSLTTKMAAVDPAPTLRALRRMSSISF